MIHSINSWHFTKVHTAVMLHCINSYLRVLIILRGINSYVDRLIRIYAFYSMNVLFIDLPTVSNHHYSLKQYYVLRNY